MALQRLDVGRDRDGLNVFEVLITGSFTPGKKLLNRPVVGGSCVSVADRDRKKFEELFAGRWAGARDDCGSCAGRPIARWDGGAYCAPSQRPSCRPLFYSSACSLSSA